jgi:hypothetical protein
MFNLEIQLKTFPPISRLVFLYGYQYVNCLWVNFSFNTVVSVRNRYQIVGRMYCTGNRRGRIFVTGTYLVGGLGRKIKIGVWSKTTK